MSLEDIGPRPQNGRLIREEEAAARRRLRVRNMLIALAGVVTGIVLIAAFFVFKILIDTQQQLKSCVEPTGQCYKDAQQNTTDIIGEPHGPINTVTALAAACADRPGVQTAQDIVACVTDALEAP
jgi:hypothetical protein